MIMTTQETLDEMFNFLLGSDSNDDSISREEMNGLLLEEVKQIYESSITRKLTRNVTKSMKSKKKG